MRRAFAAVVILISVVGLGATAHAESYPPGGPSIGVPDSEPKPGDSITITLDGFCPNDVVNLSAEGPGGTVDLGTVTVDGSGTATFPYTAPGTPGAYTIEGTGTDCDDYVASLGIVVTRGDIPAMGTDSTKSGLLIGTGALGLGVVLVGAAAIRRRRPVAA